jgi:glucokinase
MRDVAFAFSPEVIVIGGGLGLNDDLFHPAIRAHLDSEGPPAMRIELARAALGDDAGLIGAAALDQALGSAS